MQAVDAGVVGFQVGPEHAQFAGQLLQAAVVHRGLAFAQVVDEQVTDGPAGELVAVDHLGGRALARGAQFPQPGRRGRAEDAHLAQQPVAGGGIASGCPADLGLGVEQFQDVADSDAGEHAALGGQDDRGPAQGAGAFSPPLRRRSPSHRRPQLREAPGVAGGGHRAGQPGVVTSAGCQPAQRRAHDVGADRSDQC